MLIKSYINSFFIPVSPGDFNIITLSRLNLIIQICLYYFLQTKTLLLLSKYSLPPGQNRSGDNLAVMFFIHGGGYFIGTASSYPGEDLAVHGDLIVVTINYRLGTLGFFSTGAVVIYNIIHLVKLNACKFDFSKNKLDYH